MSFCSFLKFKNEKKKIISYVGSVAVIDYHANKLAVLMKNKKSASYIYMYVARAAVMYVLSIDKKLFYR